MYARCASLGERNVSLGERSVLEQIEELSVRLMHRIGIYQTCDIIK